jgi:hypothetical protein
MPFQPWHMWGNSQVLTATLGVTGPPVVASNQLAKVSYKRPDTWRFVLFGRLVGGDVATIGDTEVWALFDIALGVGRSVLQTRKESLATVLGFNAFCRMHWTVPVGTNVGAQNNNIKYCSQVLGPPLDDDVPATRETIEQIVAQDIQCDVRLVIASVDPIAVTAELGAFFAPNAHVRPDWFQEVVARRFRGAETGGT